MLGFDYNLLSFKEYHISEIILNPNLMTMARSLTLHPCSGMNAALDLYYSWIDMGVDIKDINVHATFAYYNNISIGWVLYTYEMDGFEFVPENGEACIQVYVHPLFRRRGIGKALCNKVIINCNNLVKAYSYSSPEFFLSLMKETDKIIAI